MDSTNLLVCTHVPMYVCRYFQQAFSFILLQALASIFPCSGYFFCECCGPNNPINCHWDKDLGIALGDKVVLVFDILAIILATGMYGWGHCLGERSDVQANLIWQLLAVCG